MISNLVVSMSSSRTEKKFMEENTTILIKKDKMLGKIMSIRPIR
jgi:hypothetical protein